MCTKKKLSKFDAEILLVQAEMKRKLNHRAIRQERRKYWCKECKAYHVTSIPKQG